MEIQLPVTVRALHTAAYVLAQIFCRVASTRAFVSFARKNHHLIAIPEWLYVLFEIAAYGLADELRRCSASRVNLALVRLLQDIPTCNKGCIVCTTIIHRFYIDDYTRTTIDAKDFHDNLFGHLR